jgi:hypothetical protein
MSGDRRRGRFRIFWVAEQELVLYRQEGIGK